MPFFCISTITYLLRVVCRFIESGRNPAAACCWPCSRHFPGRRPVYPAKILSLFLPTAPLQYVPKIRFTQATTDCLATNKTKNALHSKKVILNYFGGDPISHSLIDKPFVEIKYRYCAPKWPIKYCWVFKNIS